MYGVVWEPPVVVAVYRVVFPFAGTAAVLTSCPHDLAAVYPYYIWSNHIDMVNAFMLVYYNNCYYQPIQ